MKEVEQVEHDGIIRMIDGAKMEVSILSKSACLSCSVNSSCNVSDIEEKNVDVFVNNPSDYKVGEQVKVYFSQSLGFRALFLGYVLPFLIMMFTLIIAMAITGKEGLSGLLSVGILAPYYFVLYLTRANHAKTFSFSVKKHYTHFNAVNV